MIIGLLIEKVKKKVVFFTIVLENIVRTLIIIYVLNLFSNIELANLGILQASIGIFTIVIPLGFGASCQRFSINIESKEFLVSNTIYYILSCIQMIIIFFIWDYLIYRIEGLNFFNPYYKLIFLTICFLKVEISKVKAILRIKGKNLAFILLTLIPITFELLFIYSYLNSSSTAFDLFTIRIVSMLPVLLFTIYSLKYLTKNIFDKTVIIYSLLTIPNKLVTGSLGYFMNLFAYNLGTEYMAKFYSSLKLTNLLNTILNAYYQYIEPSLYAMKGIEKRSFLKIIKNIFILSFLFVMSLLLSKILFNEFKIMENLSAQIIFSIATIYLLTIIFRFISFKLFYYLRNDIVFYINSITLFVFLSVSYIYPELFLISLILSLIIKIIFTYHIDSKYFI